MSDYAERMQAIAGFKLRELCHFRKGRKKHLCRGDGAITIRRKHAPGCTGTIAPGVLHVEDRFEALPFESGTRHCLACARAFLAEEPATAPP